MKVSAKGTIWMLICWLIGTSLATLLIGKLPRFFPLIVQLLIYFIGYMGMKEFDWEKELK